MAMGTLITAAVVLAGSSATVVVAGPDALVLQIDALVDLVRRIDRLLESILDLLETVRGLFGGGGD
jgi:hypothetical protein